MEWRKHGVLSQGELVSVLVPQLTGYLIACRQYNQAQGKYPTNVNFHFLPFTRERQYLVLWSKNLAGVGAS